MTTDTRRVKRYPGLPPFRRSQAALFCGREGEISELFRQVRSESFVVIFGRSAAGKSSLLNAGLCPKLEVNGFIPVNIRMQPGRNKKSKATSLVRDALVHFQGGKPLPAGYVRNKGLSLWEGIKSCEFPFGSIPVLIFDQFEELFNSFSYERQKEFLLEVAALTHPDPPNRVLEWLGNIPIDERTAEQIAWCVQPPVKIIVAIRSDRFYELSRWSEVLPYILRSRFELKPLTKERAEEAITIPAATLKVPSPPYFPPYVYQKEALKTIIKKLSSGKNYIEASYLQIICSELEDTIQEPDYPGDRTVITLKDVKAGIDLDNIIDSFYNNQLGKIADWEQREASYELIEKHLITADGHRRLLLEHEVLSSLGPFPGLVNTLQDLRLIRGDMREDQKLYEISHDILLGAIVRSKAARQGVLDRFYETQIEKFIPSKDQDRVREFLEERMISEDRRLAVSDVEITEALGKLNVHKLVEARLIRVEFREAGNFYEISHDALLGALSKARDLRELKREKAQLQKESLKTKLRLESQRQALEKERTLKQIAEKAIAKAKSQRTISMVLAFVACGCFILAYNFYLRSERFFHDAKKSQGESISFIAEQEYQKGNHGLSFRLHQESDTLTGRAALPALLQTQFFALLAGSNITFSDNKKWIAVSQDSTVELYKNANGSFLPVARLTRVAQYKFVPSHDLFSYTNTSDSLLFTDLNTGKPAFKGDTILSTLKVGGTISDDIIPYSRYSFSQDSSILSLGGKKQAFFYSLQTGRPFAWLNATCKELIRSHNGSSFTASFLGPYLYLNIRPGRNDPKAVEEVFVIDYPTQKIVYSFKSLKLFRSDQDKRVMYFFTDMWDLVRFDAVTGKRETIMRIKPDRNFVDLFGRETVVLAGNIRRGGQPLSFIQDFYISDRRGNQARSLSNATVLHLPGGKRMISYTGADSLLHLLDPVTMKDSTAQGFRSAIQVEGSSCFIGKPVEGGPDQLFDLGSPARKIAIADAELIKTDSIGRILSFTEKNGRLYIKNLYTSQKIMDLPFNNDQFNFLGKTDIKLLTLARGGGMHLLLSSETDILFLLDSVSITYNYLDSVYPRLTKAQLSQYGLH